MSRLPQIRRWLPPALRRPPASALGGHLVGDAAERDSAGAEETGDRRKRRRGENWRSPSPLGVAQVLESAGQRGHQLSWDASRSCHWTARRRRNPAAQGISRKNLKCQCRSGL
ncbi:hypothetical protein PVAP13_9KG101120, partial [Panicum virgatum]